MSILHYLRILSRSSHSHSVSLIYHSHYIQRYIFYYIYISLQDILVLVLVLVRNWLLRSIIKLSQYRKKASNKFFFSYLQVRLPRSSPAPSSCSLIFLQTKQCDHVSLVCLSVCVILSPNKKKHYQQQQITKKKYQTQRAETTKYKKNTRLTAFLAIIVTSVGDFYGDEIDDDVDDDPRRLVQEPCESRSSNKCSRHRCRRRWRRRRRSCAESCELRRRLLIISRSKC